MRTENLTSLSAKLEVCPEATAADLLDDASCLMATVVEQLRNTACLLADGDHTIGQADLSASLFGTLYLAELAKSTLNEGHSRAHLGAAKQEEAVQ